MVLKGIDGFEGGFQGVNGFEGADQEVDYLFELLAPFFVVLQTLWDPSAVLSIGSLCHHGSGCRLKGWHLGRGRVAVIHVS